jgi:DNA-binding CsgD family transcriptional regulator
MTSLTQEQKTEIVRLYKLKVLNKNIATIMGLSKHVVNNYIYKDYLLTNERAKNTAEHLKFADQVIEMYKNELPYKTISERTGLKHYQICEILKLTTFRRRQGITIKNLREVQRMWEEGSRIASISYKLNLNYGQVEYWVRKIREGVYTSVH